MTASSISGKRMSALKKATELPRDICDGGKTRPPCPVTFRERSHFKQSSVRCTFLLKTSLSRHRAAIDGWESSHRRLLNGEALEKGQLFICR
jgi:hypothetical protein